MTPTNLVYADQASAISALAALGLSAKDKDGAAALPSTLFTADGARVDVIVAGGGSGLVSKPTGATQPGPTLPGSDQPGPAVPVYAALPGFYLTVNWQGANPPDFGAAVTTDFDAVFVAPGALASAAVPSQVPMWAAQAALKQAGHYDAINAAVLGMETSNPPVYFSWTMGNYASRTSAFIAALASSFGMTEADIDAVFRAADQIATVAG